MIEIKIIEIILISFISGSFGVGFGFMLCSALIIARETDKNNQRAQVEMEKNKKKSDDHFAQTVSET